MVGREMATPVVLRLIGVLLLPYRRRSNVFGARVYHLQSARTVFHLRRSNLLLVADVYQRYVVRSHVLKLTITLRQLRDTG